MLSQLFNIHSKKGLTYTRIVVICIINSTFRNHLSCLKIVYFNREFRFWVQ